MLTLLRAAERVAALWKNGGGITWGVAAAPEGSELERFDWRVSIARVDVDGPFSPFEGIDRQMAVLEGSLRLAVAGAAPVDLSPGTAPCTFPGDLPAEASVIRGPVLDLNLMTRRGAWAGSLTRYDVGGVPLRFAPRGVGVLVCATGSMQARPAGPSLGPLDALRVEAPGALELTGTRVSVAYFVEAWKVTAGP